MFGRATITLGIDPHSSNFEESIGFGVDLSDVILPNFAAIP